MNGPNEENKELLKELEELRATMQYDASSGTSTKDRTADESDFSRTKKSNK